MDRVVGYKPPPKGGEGGGLLQSHERVMVRVNKEGRQTQLDAPYRTTTTHPLSPTLFLPSSPRPPQRVCDLMSEEAVALTPHPHELVGDAA